MANLLDTIRQSSQVQQPGVTDEGRRLQQLLRAKSGREVSGEAVGPSSLQEQQAVTESQQQIQQKVLPQAQIQQAGLEQQQAGQQQQETQQVQQIEQQKRFDTLENKMKTDQLLNDLERDKSRLDLARDKSRLEQVGFQLRLQDKQYIDTLQREGEKRRLGDDAEFRKAMTETALGNNKQLLEKNLTGKSVIDASDQEFRKSLASMGASDAYNMFREDQKAAKQKAMWEGVGSLTSSGIGAYGTYESEQARKSGGQ